MKTLITSFLLSLSLSAMAQFLNPIIPIWPKGAPGVKEASASVFDHKDGDAMRVTRVTTPSLEPFAPVQGTANGRAVIVCPGGAYHFMAYEKEGQEIAQWLARQGYMAYVLAYRVPDDRAGALQDAQRAIRCVRAAGYREVGLIGFSAGASLSCRAATRWGETLYEPQDALDTLSCRPSFAMLIYPAYLNEGPDGTLTPELTVTAQTPPLFVFGTEDDRLYSAPSCLTLAPAMYRAGAPIELHYLTRGGHGYGMRRGAGLVWPPLAEVWLKGLTNEK